ncbi:hypothetical protein CR513_40102, partial [Mucuna pruriens]
MSHFPIGCRIDILAWRFGGTIMQYAAGIFISQKKYVLEILDRFQMKNCNFVSTPTEVGLKLVRDPEGRKVDNTLYKQIVGSLMYLTATRPDITHVNGEKTNLIGFTDCDYAGVQDNRKNTLGYVFMIGSGVVSWSSKKQPIVTLSTTKAEFVATTSCAYQAIWVRKILEELCFEQQGPTPIYCDSNSTIKLSKNPILHERMKHIDMKYHFLRNISNDGIINLIFCRSEDQVAVYGKEC